MQTGIPNACPDPEVLAAFVDRRLGATEQAGVERHLDGCRDCRQLVARVLETQDAVFAAPAADLPAAAQSVERPSQARFLRWALPSVLAAAATLIVAIQIGPRSWRDWTGGGVDSRLADLADAVGEERTVEARLSGGFRHGPLRAPVRSGGSSAPSDNWTLFAAAGRIREDAERNPNAANLHALGLAHLVLGEYDGAVRALDDAAAEDPQNARYLSDLAAAYLARARNLDRPDDVPRALGAAERAVRLDAALPEARFNRALALESLFLEQQARAAWQEYLERDQTSDWAAEARQRLEKLAARPQSDLRNNSPPAVTDETVEAGLDWLLRSGLPAWADAVLANDPARAATERAALEHYATQLTELSGDPIARVLVADADPPSAGAIRGYAKAMAAMDQENAAAAGELLLRDCSPAAEPLRALCDVELVGIDTLLRREADARRRLDSVIGAAAAIGSPYLRGRAQRMVAYRAIFSSQLTHAAEAATASFAHFDGAGYQSQAALMASQAADFLDLMGLPTDGWRWRLRALDRARRPGAGRQLFAIAVSAAGVLARRDEHDASRVFAAIAADDLDAPPGRRMIALLTQARAWLGAGDLEAAGMSADMASQVIAQGRDFRIARLRPEVLIVQAKIAAARGDVPEAQRLLDELMPQLGPERAGNKADALLMRARLHPAAASDRPVTDIAESLSLLDLRAAEQPALLADAPAAFASIATVVSERPDLHGIAGLHLAETLREIVDGVPGDLRIRNVEALAQTLERRGHDRAIVFFLLGDEAILRWISVAGRVTFDRRPTRRVDLERLIRTLHVQVVHSPEREQLWRETLRRLHVELFDGLPPDARAATDLLVVPDGALHLVPFGALVDPQTGEYVFERRHVSVTPSLALLSSATTTPGAVARVLTIGDPALADGPVNGLQPLQRARSEAMTIAGLYPSGVTLLGADANKGRVLAGLEAADVVHFAGHAVVPAGSGGPRLVLAGKVADPGSGLAPHEARFRARGLTRVVLAACETAYDSARERGAGVRSIAAGLLRTGARTVVGTLWRVDDVVSEKFFVSVHRGLSRGESSARAVASAQRACLSDPACRRSPATWLGTTVFGSE